MSSDSTSKKFSAFHEENISVTCPQDKEPNRITDIISLSSGYLIVAEFLNRKLKLLKSDGEFVSAKRSPQSSMGITNLSGEDFAICCNDGEIYFWTVQDQKIVQLDREIHVDLDVNAIRNNGKNFVVLHRFDNAVTVLDNEGNQQSRLDVKQVEGKMVDLGFDIELDVSGNIYLPCVGASKGVLCLSLEGECRWHCKLDGNVGGLAFINSMLCAVNTDLNCIHLIDNASGVYLKDILDESNLDGEPSNISYSRICGKLYVTFDEWGQMNDSVSIFAIS